MHVLVVERSVVSLCRLYRSQNHRMAKIRRNSSPGFLAQARPLSADSPGQLLAVSKEGDSSTSLCKLCHCLVTYTRKKLLPVLLLQHPKLSAALFAARTCCWLKRHLVSTGTPGCHSVGLALAQTKMISSSAVF